MEKAINEINVNERLLKKSSMTMNRDRDKLCSDEEAESGALRYERKLKAPECHKFFLKVMYHLPYDTREAILEASTKSWIKSPKKYFTYSAKKALLKLGH
ncbi:hypothetical protein IJI55_00805 [Candidatus Saccharibacteria bacterium]|nr:hypothetical protein [Candidatus Saccharibacteria bacterium]